MNIDEALDEVYRSWLRAQPLVAGKYDRDARHPEIVQAIARDLDLMPPPGRTLKITGSKGKGTTARFAADLIAQAAPTARVALFVSPHEVTQCDRIRLDGATIPEDEFCRVIGRLAPVIRAREARLPPSHYISPVGYFLLAALDWYRRAGADWFVLECGRGARWDDVGALASRVAIVTSVLNEHADKLGPRLEDIAADKFSVRETSDIVIASPAALAASPEAAAAAILAGAPAAQGRGPRWIEECRTLARRGVECLLNNPAGTLNALTPRVASASFGEGVMGEAHYIYEAAINSGSLDPSWIEVLRRLSPRIFVCLSDDKDRGGMLSRLAELGEVTEICLTGSFDYLHFEQARTGGAIALDVNDAEGLRQLVRRQNGVVYLVGTQSFIRLVRRAALIEAG